MMKRLLFPLFLSALLSSCSGILGYGVVLWNQEEHDLDDNTIVPVYVRSSILKVYVIALPDTGEKIEVPIWQVTEPKSRKEARALQQQYAQYQHYYARVLSDGLPVRSHTVNTSRQVYRLRKGEVLRVLYKGEGEAVIAGNAALDGDWFRVLTEDGTQGWFFSRYLQIYNAHEENRADIAASTETMALVEDTIAGLFSRPWYPEAYRSMVDSGKIDLSLLDPTQGFSVDRNTRIAHLKIPDFAGDFPFTGISQGTSASYTLDNSPIIITPRGADMLIVSYVNGRNLPVSQNFVTLSKDIAEVIRDERLRRQRIYDNFVRLGPRFENPQYGTITFTGSAPPVGTEDEMPRNDATLTVEWMGNNLDRIGGERGLVSFKYFLSDRMRTIYDGVITFTFDTSPGADSPGENNFFYHLLENAIQLEAAGTSAPPDNTFTGRNANPVVMLFSKEVPGQAFDESPDETFDDGFYYVDENGDSDTSAEEP
jgi:hypothetical protein